MPYEALKTIPGRRYRGRFSLDRSLVVVWWEDGRRPNYSEESLFVGSPEEMMDWLRPRQADFGIQIDDRAGRPVPVPPPPVRIPLEHLPPPKPAVSEIKPVGANMPKPPVAWKRWAALFAAAMGAAAYYFS